MPKPTDKTALVTHRGCLDGTGSAAVFIWAGGRSENIFFRDPKGCALTPEEAAPYDEVWFVDICPWDISSEPGGGKPWRVFDHHDTAIRRHAGSPHCTFDVSCCGTSLLARETGIDTQGVHEVIRAIEHYDLGRFEHPRGMQLADLAGSRDQGTMLNLLTVMKDDLLWDGRYANEARGIRLAREMFSERTAESARGQWLDPDLQNWWTAIAVAPVYWKNDVAFKVLDGREIGGLVPDIAVIVDFTAGGVSLRSRHGGPNVAMIAEGYGGGGHPQAAGFRLDRGSALWELFKEVFA